AAETLNVDHLTFNIKHRIRGECFEFWCSNHFHTRWKTASWSAGKLFPSANRIRALERNPL
ncbi:MAG: hypothetical protein KAG97_10225, partial [Victivallales bacterium]|nr:hypothetical protein [Victivallales bacterium]